MSLSTDDTHLTPLQPLLALTDCLELYDHATKLLWYGTVNQMSLKKLLSKMHKSYGASDTSKIEIPRTFAVQIECITMLQDLRHTISRLDLAKIRENIAKVGTGSLPTHLELLYLFERHGRLPFGSVVESSSNAGSASEIWGTLGRHLIPSLLRLLDKSGSGTRERDVLSRVSLRYAARSGFSDTCVKLLHQLNSTSNSSN